MVRRHPEAGRLPLLVTPGDPRGVGPEVAVASLKSGRWNAVLVGDGDAVAVEARRQAVALRRVTDLPVEGTGQAGEVRLLEPPPGDEPVEIRALRLAVEACLGGRGAGLVTGPIHKARLAARGFPFPGHTGFLGHLCGVPEPVMAFVGGRLRVALVTVHLPLRDVPAALDRDRILHVIQVAAGALAEDLGIRPPRLVVAGLNPHAGDEGLLGREELEVIGPACDAARGLGLLVEGPLSAEAAARAAVTGAADLMVAMFHDQGLAPLKVLDFGRSVNWTLGLPIIRTSVDHGTADDIAGQGRADPGSMCAALDLAARLARSRARTRRAGR